MYGNYLNIIDSSIRNVLHSFKSPFHHTKNLKNSNQVIFFFFPQSSEKYAKSAFIIRNIKFFITSNLNNKSHMLHGFDRFNWIIYKIKLSYTHHFSHICQTIQHYQISH